MLAKCAGCGKPVNIKEAAMVQERRYLCPACVEAWKKAGKL